ncbi:hypothetical protein [Robertkochia solimangrovi]|uniref:hypothetical protein n=1 Tax=Robertkochia solimangrovi TaxID=2213046 RepID=UPI00117CD358|nr:hypothetical protein [Robertkochia solimangrovi]TRZ46080.1 hypothetical protein DMZ48_02085 [Robertkochia solimangrovi]
MKRLVLGTLVLAGLIILLANPEDRIYSRSEMSREKALLKRMAEGEAKYEPEDRIRSITDTVLTNKFRVRTDVYEQEDPAIKFYYNKNGMLDFLCYRKYELDLKVLFNNRTILDRKIVSDFFRKEYQEEYWTNAILSEVSIDQLNSTASWLNVKVAFKNPILEEIRYYDLKINNTGVLKAVVNG